MSRSFLEDKQLAHEELSAQRTLRKVRPGKLEQFSVDLCLIAHGIRSACLVDTFAVQDSINLFSRVLAGLRSKVRFDQEYTATQFIEQRMNQSTIFADIVHWYDPSSLQSFIVNSRVLRVFAETLLEDGNAVVTYVLLGAFPTLLASTPKTVLDVVCAMNADMLEYQAKISFSFVDGLTQEILVPLAATLIGYPVAYIPISADQTSFLSGQPLDVYEANVVPETSRTSSFQSSNQSHTLLKFSCPCSLAETNRELSPARVTKRLQSQFQENLSSIGSSLFVHHHVEIVDRVAL
ncbi:hypothetical protein DEU56DRAFT_494849 [Suillus clintonianus]|uniref:uncharacterized protein n=1 Tax=Suillus clintonianus TaxID=1904413 RepID=UPI001B86D61E|nr:uncharacterized protein DEU56DRAFT_494849 [Suillus clintonianus]KAG2129451.1 hypothetical protein DEU56DRAFT_494849 [Suillus clintonianus]